MGSASGDCSAAETANIVWQEKAAARAAERAAAAAAAAAAGAELAAVREVR